MLKYQTKAIVFKLSLAAILNSISFILLSMAPFCLLLTIGVMLNGLTVFLASIPCSVLFYNGISCIFSRRILIGRNDLKYYHGPFKYDLDIHQISVYCETVLVFGGNFKPTYGLVLYRNKEKVLGISMNNRFVLDYAIDEVKLEIYQKEFKEKLGIEILVVKAAM